MTTGRRRTLIARSKRIIHGHALHRIRHPAASTAHRRSTFTHTPKNNTEPYFTRLTFHFCIRAFACKTFKNKFNRLTNPDQYTLCFRILQFRNCLFRTYTNIILIARRYISCTAFQLSKI